MKLKKPPVYIKFIISIISCFVIFSFLVLCSENFFIITYAPYAKHGENETVLQNPFISYPETNIDIFYDQLMSKKETSDKTKGWLYLPGTDINDPVMQYKDNDYFLRRDSNENYSYYGCYFADFRTNLSSEKEISKNIVLYGHNIFDDNKYFAQLLKYKDWEHLINYPYIYFATENGVKTYRIYCAFYTFTNFYYINPNPSKEEFDYVLNEAKKRSLYNIDVPVSYEDNIITLSTCCYKYKTSWGSSRNDQRFVIQAVEIKQGNNEYNIPTINPSPKEPYVND